MHLEVGPEARDIVEVGESNVLTSLVCLFFVYMFMKLTEKEGTLIRDNWLHLGTD